VVTIPAPRKNLLAVTKRQRYCGFVQTKESAEIGWRLAPEYWGQGLATEAARVVLEHGFQELSFQRVIATVQAENRASIRVIEKLDMQHESSFQRNGRDVFMYEIGNDKDEESGTS
jgi:[ribosomal protein S5]-alanine N-acetyltransferase